MRHSLARFAPARALHCVAASLSRRTSGNARALAALCAPLDNSVIRPLRPMLSSLRSGSKARRTRADKAANFAARPAHVRRPRGASPLGGFASLRGCAPALGLRCALRLAPGLAIPRPSSRAGVAFAMLGAAKTRRHGRARFLRPRARKPALSLHLSALAVRGRLRRPLTGGARFRRLRCAGRLTGRVAAGPRAAGPQRARTSRA